MTHLTDAFVRQLQPQAKLQQYSDDKVPGFGIRVTPGGVKSFVLRYRNSRGVERLLTIGRFDTWLVAGARRHASELVRTQINIGIDPVDERRAVRDALTVNQLLDLYVDSARFNSKAENTARIDRGRLDRHIRPLLGKRVVEELTLDQIESTFADIRDGKTAGNVKTGPHGLARVRGGAGTARSAIRLLRAAFNWAMREKLITGNPATGAQVGRDGVRKLILDADGYAAMFKALAKLEAAGTIKHRQADAIRLIALTGARRGEVVGLRREHVDLKRCRIVLPPSQHKAGKVTGMDRVIGLPEAAVALLRPYVEDEDDDLLFGGDGPGLGKAWREVRREAKLPKDFGMHGLRHSVASHLAMGGAGASQIMTALGHRQLSTSQKYIHWIDEARDELAERAAGPALAGMRS